MAISTKYTFQRQVNSLKLLSEISSAGLAVAVQHIDSTDNEDGTWETDIWFLDILSDTDVTTLNTTLTNHTIADSTSDIVRTKIIAARKFGQYMIDEVATDNVLANISTSDVASMLSKYADVLSMLQSGSLYTALAAMQAATPDTVMTQDRINKYINQVKTYLGIV